MQPHDFKIGDTVTVLSDRPGWQSLTGTVVGLTRNTVKVEGVVDDDGFPRVHFFPADLRVVNGGKSKITTETSRREDITEDIKLAAGAVGRSGELTGRIRSHGAGGSSPLVAVDLKWSATIDRLSINLSPDNARALAATLVKVADHAKTVPDFEAGDRVKLPSGFVGVVMEVVSRDLLSVRYEDAPPGRPDPWSIHAHHVEKIELDPQVEYTVHYRTKSSSKFIPVYNKVTATSPKAAVEQRIGSLSSHTVLQPGDCYKTVDPEGNETVFRYRGDGKVIESADTEYTLYYRSDTNTGGDFVKLNSLTITASSPRAAVIQRLTDVGTAVHSGDHYKAVDPDDNATVFRIGENNTVTQVSR